MKDIEPLNVEELYENDEIILTKSLFENDGIRIINIDVGIKNKAGDIIRFVTVDAKIID